MYAAPEVHHLNTLDGTLRALVSSVVEVHHQGGCTSVNAPGAFGVHSVRCASAFNLLLCSVNTQNSWYSTLLLSC